VKPTPGTRIRSVNGREIRPDGAYVLYWMTAARRPGWNFGLQRAVEQCRALGRPLVVLEALRAAYPYASDRLHTFVLEGVADNQGAFGKSRALYFPYIEPAPGRGKGLLEAIAANACAVVTDEFPCFFLPRMVEAAGWKLPVSLEAVDSNGLLPLSEAAVAFPTAYAFRRFLQKRLPLHLAQMPEEDPLKALPDLPPPRLPAEVARRWPAATPEDLRRPERLVASLPIRHDVGPTPARGGPKAAGALLARFVRDRLERYDEDRNEPSLEATSGLSPFLHFGHISAHKIFAAVAGSEGWSPDRLAPRAGGKKAGWWGMSPPAEAFLDQVVTWRGLGYSFCARRPEEYAGLESLPTWAWATLEKHRPDLRPHRYGAAQLEAAETHDPLWNAAQRQLLREGRIHNYLRMLWGKKILEWTRDPQEALDVMARLNDTYALDGRDPNSYAGILWCLGRHDRPWGPERAVYGTVRYMSSESAARKFDLGPYLDRYRA
jgi:deoxyribodipyrimidine photo-lyase